MTIKKSNVIANDKAVWFVVYCSECKSITSAAIRQNGTVRRKGKVLALSMVI